MLFVHLSVNITHLAGIYFHIPFCKQACHYCDFHFSTQLSGKDAFLKALLTEIALQKDYLDNEPIRTLYFGGGTPSLLDKGELTEIFDQVSQYFRLTENAEISLEANPDDLSLDKLSVLKTIGINRLSIGIQTFHEPFLKLMNRAHSAQESLTAIALAREAGFENLSADLIYGFPHTDHSIWEQDLETMMSQRPEHISAYCLTVEDKTALGTWTKKGQFKPATDDYAARQFEMLVQTLQQNGYHQYEVSNFSLPSFESKHNSNYWKQEKYLGLGPSAHSFDGQSRQYNVSHNIRYAQSLENGNVPYQKEILSRADKINEYLMTNLRTSWGCDTNWLREVHHYDLMAENKGYVHTLIQQNLATFENGKLILSLRGKLLADKIAADLFIVP